MSIYGSVILYTNATTDAALNAIEEFRNVAPFEEWMDAWRCEPPGQLSEVILHENERDILPTFGKTLIGRPASNERVLKEMRKTRKSAVRGTVAAAIAKVIDAEFRAMPETVRGTSLYGSPGFVVGPHDVANLLGDYRYFGQATFSLEFFGWGSPPNSLEFPEQFVALPTVSKLRTAVEKHVGRLQVCYCGVG